MLEVLVLELILTDDDDWVVKVGGADKFLSSQNQVHWFAGAFVVVDQIFLVSPGQVYRSGNLL
jgi:hypothetical protein